MMLELVKAETVHKYDVLSYKAAFVENGESIPGSSDLLFADSYETWLEMLDEYASKDTCPSYRVPAIQFLAYDDGALIGTLDIRLELDEYLLKYGGHIGYSVLKSQRGKGYATTMLALGLQKCKEMNFEKVLLTTNKDNFASVKTIRNNGGVFENELLDGEETIQRYWLPLY